MRIPRPIAVEICDNVMLLDNGPKQKEADTAKCDKCKCKVEVDELQEIEHVPYFSSEETPSEFSTVCESCLNAMRADKSIVIV